ncbi:alpha-amylase family glycosyl hydrolase [Croceibacter atlanticus]|uniref:alpha-amylase family glycosyl hydrolase n=1 Tax=Croceibacter atlanticus TaxID=313588 RepID=UPI0030F7E703
MIRVKHIVPFSIVLLGLLAVSCNTKGKALGQPSVIKGMATPIRLDVDSTSVLLTDYFLNVSEIDSTSTTKGFESSIDKDKTTLNLKTLANAPALGNLRVWTNGVVNDIPLFKSAKESKTISFKAEENQFQTVQLKGEFTNWGAQPMRYANGEWTYSGIFNPGNHQYVLIADGKEMNNPDETETVDNGMGGTNSVISIGNKNALKPELSTGKNNVSAFTVKIKNNYNTVLAYLDNQLIDGSYEETDSDEIYIKIPKGLKGRHLIRVYASNINGRGNDILVPLENSSVISDASKLERTDFHTQIMYFLMVDRFKDGDLTNTKKVDNDSILPKANYYGGDLQGVLDKVKDGYFKELGINTVWLSPITQNPEGAYGLWPEPLTKFSGYHGYWPISNTKIDYRFGDEALFKELIEEAHKQNMNVLLDYVANHVHEEHPLYKEHPEWATELYLPDGTLNTERWDDHRLTTWFDTFMPTLDFSKPEVVETMTDSAAYWVTNYDLDGFRHDATKHIQLDFWRTLTRKVKERTDRPIYQIGETYGSYELINSYINTGMLDAQFDFNLYDAEVSTFAKNETSFERLANTLQQGLNYYGSHHLMGNISGNQDKARFISYASGDVSFEEDAKKAGWTREITMSDTTAYKKLAQLQAFNLSVPGIPVIYYGDEYGSIGGNDPDNRRWMKFENLNNQETKLKNTVTSLVNKRRNSMALQYGETKILRADNEVMIIERNYFTEEVYVVFNKTNKAQDINVDGNTITVEANGFNFFEK